MKRMVFKLRFLSFVVFAIVAGVWPTAAQAATNPNPNLGSAAGYAVLAGSKVTCTTSTVTGNVGVSPGTAVIQTSCTINGAIHANDTAAINANKAFHDAYAIGLGPCGTTTLDATATGVTSLGPGTYCTGADLTLKNRTLTLTGKGSWFFEIPAGFTTTDLNVVMANGGNPCNVFWWVGADTTLTVDAGKGAFLGTILGGGAISLTGLASDRSALTLTGRAWASGKAGAAPTPVTMTNATIVGCNAAGKVGKPCKESKDKHGDADKDCDNHHHKHKHHHKDKDHDKDKGKGHDK
jgi:hypothetical protein